MKNLIYTFCILSSLCLNTLTLKSNIKHKPKYDSLTCLKIEGTISNLIDDEDDCIIELISNEYGIDTIVLKEGKNKFKLLLKKNTYYGIRISKKGFITKLVSVNTEILTQTDDIYRFKFETRIMKEAALKNLNSDVVDFPVAIVSYDYEKEGFYHNKEYTSYIKRELHKQTPTYQSLELADNNTYQTN